MVLTRDGHYCRGLARRLGPSKRRDVEVFDSAFGAPWGKSMEALGARPGPPVAPRVPLAAVPEEREADLD
eukprot:3665436-Alexandrium_andersonii.AAC.1